MNLNRSKIMSAIGGSAYGGKKILLGVLVFAFALTLSACGKNMQEIEKSSTGKAIKEQSGGMISSIKDAMGMKKKMKCTFKMEAGGEKVESVSYIDGEKYRSESKMMNMNQIAVYDGEDMYSWSKGQKTGMKFSKKCSEEMQAQNQEQNQERNQEQVKVGAEAFDGAMDVKCEEVANIDFSIPTDIEFTDQCEQMKQMQKQAGDMQKQAEEMMKNMPNMPQ